MREYEIFAIYIYIYIFAKRRSVNVLNLLVLDKQGLLYIRQIKFGLYGA